MSELATQPIVDREATPEHWATVEANLGLVYAYLQRHPYYRRSSQADFDDAVQDGVIGLLRAVQVHDPAKGKLSTAARFWIPRFVEGGRETFEGVNYRRVKRRTGGEWAPPLSLEKEQGDDATLADLLVAADDRPLGEFLDMWDEALPHCRDEIDRWALMALMDEVGRPEAAAHCGCSHQTITNRQERLRQWVRHPQSVAS